MDYCARDAKGSATAAASALSRGEEAVAKRSLEQPERRPKKSKTLFEARLLKFFYPSLLVAK